MPEAFTNFMNGCAPFWIANSITSTYLGETNRERQFEIAKENEDFQLVILPPPLYVGGGFLNYKKS